MTTYYEILETLRDSLESNPIVNTVTKGSIYDIDTNKRTLFPLSHIMVNKITYRGGTLVANISILHMDIEDVSNELPTDKFRGSTDEEDILNTQLAVAVRTLDDFKRGNNYDQLYQLEGDADLEPWTERFENALAGWTSTFDVTMQNDMTICS